MLLRIPALTRLVLTLWS